MLIIVVVNGYVLGGGCECVLVIDYCLVMLDLCIGLLEIKLGIMSGFGGFVCMLCMLGVDSVLEIIVVGKDVGVD